MKTKTKQTKVLELCDVRNGTIEWQSPSEWCHCRSIRFRWNFDRMCLRNSCAPTTKRNGFFDFNSQFVIQNLNTQVILICCFTITGHTACIVFLFRSLWLWLFLLSVLQEEEIKTNRAERERDCFCQWNFVSPLELSVVSFLYIIYICVLFGLRA